jgi:hypothetical protein
MHTCVYNATFLGWNATCSTGSFNGALLGMCAPGLYCDRYYYYPGTPPTFKCLSLVAAGGLCPVQSSGPGCAPGLTCIPVNNSAGLCAPFNSLPNGATFYIPYFFSILQIGLHYGMGYCASGLAVPVANASTGYPAPYGRCVAAFDLTHEGEPCGQCAWKLGQGGSWSINDKTISLLPVHGDGSLVCAPTTMNSSSHPCVLLSSSIYAQPFLTGWFALARCQRAAVGPSGTPCSSQSSNAFSGIQTGTCSSFSCFGNVLSLYTSLLSGGVYNGFIDAFWGRYSPDILLPGGCQEQSIETLIAYLGRMDYTAMCGLPPTFAAVGWSCPLPSPSPGPGAAASASAPPTPGQSASRTPTPSVTPLPGLAVVQVGSGK